MLARYNGNVVPFADDATSTNRTVFGGTTQSDTLDDNLNADFKKGWEIVGLNDNPTREDFNAMGYTLGALTAYLYEMGIAEWNASQNYRINSRVIGSDGKIYKALTGTTGTPNIGSNPTTDTVNWKYELLDLTDYSTLTAKTTPANNDLLALGDSTSSFSLKKLTFANLKAFTSPSSTETVSGIIKLATTAEAQAGTNDSIAITPLKLFNSLKGNNQYLALNGYQKLHGGLIIQWGGGTVSANVTLTVNYPIAFTTAVLNLVGSIGGSASYLQPLGFVPTASNATFSISNFNTQTVPVYWFAIGY